jgi:hypothetical protein
LRYDGFRKRILRRMTRDFFDPTPEHQHVVLIDEQLFRRRNA